MANSAIAQYVHSRLEDPEGDYWGVRCTDGDPDCEWVSDSENPWQAAINARGTELAAGEPEFGSPLPTDQALFETGWADGDVTLEAFRKVLYYHATQRFYYTASPSTGSWVGRDGLKGFSLAAARSLLDAGRPVTFTFDIKGGGSHAIVLTQVIELNGTSVVFFYDNVLNLALARSRGVAPFLRLEIPASHRESRWTWTIDVQETRPPSTVKSEYLVQGAGLLPWDDSDSQWIYGSPRPPMVTATEPPPVPLAIPGLIDPQRQLLLERGYARILIVGAESFQVFPEGGAAPLEPVFRGELDGNAVAYDGGAGALTTTVYLPAPMGMRYEVQVTKGATSPVLMIYVDVPASGESCDAVGYENLESASNERTMVAITVGRGNTDLDATRTSASGTVDTVKPTFAELATLAVPAVEALAAIRDEDIVQLSWVNPVHAGFEGVTVVRTENGPATAITGGTVVFEGTGTAASDTPTGSAAVYYTVFSMSGGTTGSSSWVSILPTLPCITGLVTADGAAQAGAVITVASEIGPPLTATTDTSGRYDVCDLLPDRYVITCEKAGVEFEESARTLLVDTNSRQVDFDGAVVSSIAVTSPSGGERWIVGSMQYIGWTSTGAIESVGVELSRDGGVTWEVLAASSPNDGTLAVDVSRPPSRSCVVRVHAAGTDASAQSASAFSIVEPSRVHRKLPRK